MGKIDLDAARAAREEKSGKPHEVIWGGQPFFIGPELDLEAHAASQTDDPYTFVRSVLGDQWDAFSAARRPTIEDARELATAFADLMGFESPGESPASLASSRSNGRRSKPTSKGTTASTSATPSGDQPTDD